jgi:hypothetical protein
VIKRVRDSILFWSAIGLLIGSSVMFGIGHRKPCQMHLPNVSMGDQQQ